jgi:hypothetical protein
MKTQLNETGQIFGHPSLGEVSDFVGLKASLQTCKPNIAVPLMTIIIGKSSKID